VKTERQHFQTTSQQLNASSVAQLYAVAHRFRFSAFQFSVFSISAFETRSLPALTRSYPRRFTFYVAHPNRSIVSRSLPAMLDRYLRGVTGHVAHPIRSIQLFSFQRFSFFTAVAVTAFSSEIFSNE
jgi:hypothetical protein